VILPPVFSVAIFTAVFGYLAKIPTSSMDFDPQHSDLGPDDPGSGPHA